MSVGSSAAWDARLSFAAGELVANHRQGGAVTLVTCPELEERTLPSVELVTRDHVGELAIEHTRIEAYEGQIVDPIEIAPYAERLADRLADRLPPGSRFELVLDVRAANGVKPSVARLDRIAEWVALEAPGLVDGRPGVQGGHMVKAAPPDLPFPATLSRWPVADEVVLPAFSVRTWRPEDLEERRLARASRAFADKLPKLLSARTGGREALLILESNDIQLSNAWTIAEAVQKAAGGFADLPEWIVLVESETTPPFGWIIRAEGAWRDPEGPCPLTVRSALPGGCGHG